VRTKLLGVLGLAVAIAVAVAVFASSRGGDSPKPVFKPGLMRADDSNYANDMRRLELQRLKRKPR